MIRSSVYPLLEVQTLLCHLLCRTRRNATQLEKRISNNRVLASSYANEKGTGIKGDIAARATFNLCSHGHTGLFRENTILYKLFYD